MYRIKGWNKFQHFKDRRPPWIKLYRDILEDPDWHELDGETAKILVSLWLIASEDLGGALPDTRRLAFRLRMKETQLKQALTKLSHWLERSDINAISNGYQDDAPETETETETETERRPAAVSCPDGVDPQVWKDFLSTRKVKVTQTALKMIQRESQKAGWSLQSALQECTARGWRGFKADWVAGKNVVEKPVRWNSTIQGIMEKGKELGVVYRQGETIGQYEERIKETMTVGV